MRSNTTKRTSIIAGITAAMMLAGSAIAVAGIGIIVEPTGERADAVFDFDGFSPCAEPDYRIWDDDNDSPGELKVGSVDVTLNNGDPAQGTFTVPDDLPGDRYWFELACDEEERNGDFDILDNGGEIEPGYRVAPLGFARLFVEVEVEGDVPDGTTFEVEVTCEVQAEPEVQPRLENGGENRDPVMFTETRTFDVDGGTEQVVLYDVFRFFLASADFDPYVGDIPAECEVTQTDDGGAESTTSEPPANSPVDVTVDAAGNYTVTFTNTFPTAVDEEEEEPTDVEADDDEVEDEAEPAEPVEAEPDFTG